MLGEAAESLLAGSVTAQALPFARAIALQTAYPLGAAAASGDAEIAAVRAVVKLLRSAADGAADLSLSATGSGFEARFVAAVFQNLDLLYVSDFPHVDAVSSAVLQAVWVAGEDPIADGFADETDDHGEGGSR
ncbi:MAG: hypothetical protein H0U67_15165 [Gemmatimonadetes bacterium]|nr:hypothetical protein [Gemmatimonadota bacterium]